MHSLRSGVAAGDSRKTQAKSEAAAAATATVVAGAGIRAPASAHANQVCIWQRAIYCAASAHSECGLKPADAGARLAAKFPAGQLRVRLMWQCTPMQHGKWLPLQFHQD